MTLFFTVRLLLAIKIHSCFRVINVRDHVWLWADYAPHKAGMSNSNYLASRSKSFKCIAEPQRAAGLVIMSFHVYFEHNFSVSEDKTRFL